MCVTSGHPGELPEPLYSPVHSSEVGIKIASPQGYCLKSNEIT